jgi:hypothetical protein
MRGVTRGLATVAVLVGIAAVAACKSSTEPQNISLAGAYVLHQFVLGGTDLSQASSGTLALTDTAYAVHIAITGGVPPEIVDSGSYVATDSGSFSETSRLTGMQISGTYTLVNNLLTVSATQQGVPVTQAWQKQ